MSNTLSWGFWSSAANLVWRLQAYIIQLASLHLYDLATFPNPNGKILQSCSFIKVLLQLYDVSTINLEISLHMDFFLT